MAETLSKNEVTLPFAESEVVRIVRESYEGGLADGRQQVLDLIEQQGMHILRDRIARALAEEAIKVAGSANEALAG